MNSSSDSSGPPGHDQRTRRARGGSASVHEGNFIDRPNDMNRNITESIQQEIECSSPDGAPASKEKSSFASHVIGLFPFARGSPQRPHAMNTDQQVNTHNKLEEDFVALQKTCETLEKVRKDAVNENKQLHSKLKNAEAQLALKKARDQQIDIKSVKARNSMLRNDLGIAENNIARLQAAIHTAEEKFQTAEIAAAEKISRLTSDVDTVNEELFKEKSAARNEISQLQSQIKLLNEKNDKFRQMIIPVSEKQVLDVEVMQKFTSLRSSIIALVRRTWTLKLRHDINVRDFSNGQHYIFKSGDLSSYDRLRYVVFHFIYQGVFNAKNFFLKDGFEHLENYLQKVENGLCETSPVENRKLLMEWRNASFKATEDFRDNGGRLSRNTQSKIWRFLGPLQMVDPAAEGVGIKKLETVCDAAVDLSLTIRQLQDNFWVDDMQAAVHQPLSEWDKFTEEVEAVPAGDGKQPGTIAYVIAGALIKNPKENLEMVLVLEKAEVAVYR
ncbi:hypothetical protein LA080_006795 [Diaporthe eres]|nr:hypothetical protein LA080_006795 [Diaporthe eres]